MVKTGQKLRFDETGVEVIVTSGGEGEVEVRPADADGLKAGKRYLCVTSGVQVLVVKPGPVELWCADRPMEIQEPKKTKAAD